MSKHDETEKMERALETAGREFGKHSGPQSDERERRTFARDLHIAALRYARAYYAEARELGLIPVHQLTYDEIRAYAAAAVYGSATDAAACRACGSPDHRISDAVCVRDNT